MGFLAIFDRKLRSTATAAITASRAAKAPSATAGTASPATTAEAPASTTTTRPAGATTARGLTHLLENPLPLLLAQRLNIPAS